MWAASIGQVGRGLGPGILTPLGPKWHTPFAWLDAISQGPSLDFQSPTLSQLPSVMDPARIKSITQEGPYKS
jgi:hypothetical protein